MCKVRLSRVDYVIGYISYVIICYATAVMPQFFARHQVQLNDVSRTGSPALSICPCRPFLGLQAMSLTGLIRSNLTASLLPWKGLQCSRNCSMLMPEWV